MVGTSNQSVPESRPLNMLVYCSTVQSWWSIFRGLKTLTPEWANPTWIDHFLEESVEYSTKVQRSYTVEPDLCAWNSKDWKCPVVFCSHLNLKMVSADAHSPLISIAGINAHGAQKTFHSLWAALLLCARGYGRNEDGIHLIGDLEHVFFPYDMG